MIRGQLSGIQRDQAWQDIDPAMRSSASAIPQDYDPNEPTPEQIAFRARIEREQELDDNFGRGDIAKEVGRITTGAGAARQNEFRLEADRKKGRKDQVDRHVLLAALNNRIAELDYQLGVGAQFAEDLENGELPELDAQGRIADEEREAFIQAYEERTGITVDRTDLGALRAAVDAQNAHLGQEREVAADQLSTMDRESPDYAVDDEAIIVDTQRDQFRQQVSAQADGMTSDNTEESHVSSFRSIEDEIQHFMQEFARTQSIGDDMARLAAEQVLVANLSEGAESFVSMGEDTEHLFEENYFDRLDENVGSEGAAVVEASVTAPVP